MIKKLRIALAALVVAAASFSAQADQIKVGSSTREYVKYVPEDLGPKRPLLISMHGYNQDANYQMNMLQPESVADTAEFAVVFPNGIDRAWDLSGSRDVDFVLALIEEMVDKYDIDRNRVYLSGFSMGGMFTYMCMNRIADKIAAFAPISGYPLGGASYTSARPVPIIHTHGTGDDVCDFNGALPVIAGWVSRNGCPSTAEVTTGYRTGITTRHVWGPGDDGVEVVLMELKDKGHWISNDGYKTVEEIWKFCSRFSLDKTRPEVKITSPIRNGKYVTYGDDASISDMKITATAKSPESTITTVKFYGDDKYLGEVTSEPYEWVWDRKLRSGKHKVRIEVVDDQDAVVSSSLTFSISRSVKPIDMSANFAAGEIPEGWTTYDGTEGRIGALTGLGSGARVLQMTGSPRDFDLAMYTRNTTGGADCGLMAYAAPNSLMRLTLDPGKYNLTFTTCNWNMPSFGEVRYRVKETATGAVVASSSITPKANVGNTASNPFSGASEVTLPFTIDEKKTVYVEFLTVDGGWADALVAKAKITRDDSQGVDLTEADHGEVVSRTFYDVTGRELHQPTGLVIESVRYTDGTVKTRKTVK